MIDYRQRYEHEHATNRNYRIVNNGIRLLPHFRDLLKPGESILDVGCGNGKLCCMLADQGYDVTGVDVADGGYQRPFRFVQRDLTREWNLPAVDLGVCFDVIEHIAMSDVDYFFKQFFACTRRQIFSIAHFETPDCPELHLTVWPRDQWLNYLGKGVRVLHDDTRAGAEDKLKSATLFIRE